MRPPRRLGLPLSCFLLLCLAFSTLGDTTHTTAAQESDAMNAKLAYPTGHSADASASTSGPGSIPLDVERYPQTPAELELEQVHIYVRHGERTPVRVRMSDPPASIPARWQLCKTARQFRAAVASSLDPRLVENVPVRRVVEREDGSVVEGECLLGELTDLGRQNTYNFGNALRRLYVDRLGFLPDIARSDGEIYFRSTNVPRTYESLHQIIYGLYPAAKCLDGYVPQLRVRNSKDENLFGNTGACKRLELLEIGFARAAAAAWNHALEPLDKRLSKFIGGNPIRLDGRPRASGLLDTIRSAEANGISVPREFHEKGVLEIIEKAVVHEWFGGYEAEEVRKLGMGRLLADVSTKMQKKALNGPKDQMRLLVHSTHDTTIAGICATLDVFDERWPAFTSYISFELFRRKDAVLHNQSFLWQSVLSKLNRSEADDYYVRMRYQNRNISLPICAEEGKHLPGQPEFCKLAAFRDRVRELTPVDWEAECATDGKST